MTRSQGPQSASFEARCGVCRNYLGAIDWRPPDYAWVAQRRFSLHLAHVGSPVQEAATLAGLLPDVELVEVNKTIRVRCGGHELRVGPDRVRQLLEHATGPIVYLPAN